MFKKLTSLGAEAAAGAPAIITGASDIFNLVLRRELRSATSSRFSLEISSTRRTIFSGNTFKYNNMTNKELGSIFSSGLFLTLGLMLHHIFQDFLGKFLPKYKGCIFLRKFGPDRFSRFDVYWIETN